ncbi:MAG: ribonuclease D [Nocardioidaceae bacterium]|nr:ribonuclease D [Nocardioidaceae bacterium]
MSAPHEQTPPAQEPVAEAAPKPLLELRDGLSPVVSTPAALDRAVAAFAAGHGPVALDAERASGYRYSQRAYLVQMRRAGAGTLLIDPATFGDVPNDSLLPLAEAIRDAEWVIHAASQDLACLAELGMQPAQLFDTELAGRLLNYPRVGLAVMVEDLLGYRMRKEHSAVDWSKRPLPEPWLVYAALDVELLLELRDELARQLEEAGKADWARQEFAAWAQMGPTAPRIDPWRRTSGMHRVRGRRGLAFVREMWRTRDALARKRDVTPSRILPDAAIVEAAQETPTSRTALSELAGFATRGGQRYLRDFYAAALAAGELADRELPPLSPRYDGPPPPRNWAAKHPVAADRLARCRAAVSALAVEHDLPQENLLAPDVVRRLAWTPPKPPSVEHVVATLAALGARPWQRELTAATLADVLAAAPTVSPADVGPGSCADGAVGDSSEA